VSLSILERKGVWGASVRKGVLKKSSNPEGKKEEGRNEDAIASLLVLVVLVGALIDFENNDCSSMMMGSFDGLF
jgi:hypothetical protein